MRTAEQIVTRACRIARAPAFLSDAGDSLNDVLNELCQNYDFDYARGVTNFTFSSATGSGPYALPSDWLRSRRDDVFYTINGVPYAMVNIDMAEYDGLVQQPGLASYPQNYAVDLSLESYSVPQMYVWPPPAGSYPVTARYQRQMPEITSPATSATVPWFPDQNYLITRLAAEVMKITNDSRLDDFLGDGPHGAQGILNRYLKLANDDEDRAKRVTLDKRLFNNDFFRLRNTKTIGW